MSITKRELESPDPQVLSKKKRRTGEAEADVASSGEESDSQAINSRHSAKKNLLKGGALPNGKAYKRKRIVLDFYIPPIDTSDPLAGVERQLDDVLLTYVKEAEGILMGWRDPHFLDASSRILDESPFSYASVSVETIVWRPRRGEELEGSIKLMGASHIGMLILGTFNASIPATLIPSDWSFEEHYDGEEGNWKDGNGTALQIDGPLLFKTVNIKKGANILSVEGSLLDQVFQPKYQDGTSSQSPVPGTLKSEGDRETPVVKESRTKAEKERSKAERKAAKAAKKASQQK